MRPVLWWAAVGGVCFAFELFLLVAWIASGPERVPTGPTAVPTFMKVNIIIQQVLSPMMLLGTVWWFVVRPWRREGRISWDGCFLVAGASVIWQDILYNYVQPLTLWNSYFLNWGSWYGHVPGWVSPNPEGMAEAVMMSGFWYPGGLLLGAILGTFLLRKAKARWPRLGVVGLVAVCFGIFAIVDTILEVFYLRLGLYVYPTSGKNWTLFHGHYYQFPIYQSIFWGAAWAVMAASRYFRDDKGRSFVERGIDEVRGTEKTKAGLRILALAGILNLAFLLIYNVPIMFIQGLHPSTWPEDIQKRSYFTNGLCGPGTDRACPGGSVPIPLPTSVRLAPDGSVTVPPGVKLPDVVGQAK